ncbi:MAG: hypothetical protein DRH57_01505 [Candidatus Cloacimonadota bacterium]|nr:MAG: hypothetical protein DRH57_01505 [Candidatus Cloacimonadota bacterium]
MAYTFFYEEDQFHNDVEEYINGYINLYEIQEAYPIQKVIAAVQDAYNRQVKEYEDNSGWNKITILSAQHVVKNAIEEIEEEYPMEEYPEKWI